MNKHPLLLLLPAAALAHTGHPAPEGHGDLTHLILGVALALPIILAVCLWSVRIKKEAQKQNVSKTKD